MRMSADLLSERQRREKIEEEKYMIEGELSKFKRDMEMRHSLIGDGLENAQQDEVASKFSKFLQKTNLSDQSASYCESYALKDFLYDDIDFSCYARKTQEND